VPPTGREPDPLPEHIVRSLMSAGLSPTTAKAMAAWKAREVLDLLAEELPTPRRPRRRPLRSPGGTL